MTRIMSNLSTHHFIETMERTDKATVSVVILEEEEDVEQFELHRSVM